jgi:hypothetical protein
LGAAPWKRHRRSPRLRAGFQPGLHAARPVHIFLGRFRKGPNASGIETRVQFRRRRHCSIWTAPALASRLVTKRFTNASSFAPLGSLSEPTTKSEGQFTSKGGAYQQRHGPSGRDLVNKFLQKTVRAVLPPQLHSASLYDKLPNGERRGPARGAASGAREVPAAGPELGRPPADPRQPRPSVATALAGHAGKPCLASDLAGYAI